MACRMLVPWPQMESVPPAMEVQSVNHWTTGEVPVFVFKLYASHFLSNVFKFLLLWIRFQDVFLYIHMCTLTIFFPPFLAVLHGMWDRS